MKYSKQREIVKKVILNSRDHPSANDIYNIIKKDYPKISLATIYRNLNHLAEEGTIRKIESSYGSDRFDFQLKHHYHMFCKKCGSVYDINLDEFSNIEDKIKTMFGFNVTDLNIEGECPKCINKI